VGGPGPRARGWLRAGLVAAAVLAADQATKALVRADLGVGERRGLVAFVDLVHTTNDGVAFGALGGGGLLVGLVVGAAVAALLTYFALNAGRPLVWLPTGMLVGGAIGNIVDRIRAGAVTDFLKVPHWPAFNLADAAITIGVVLLLLVLERNDGAPRRA
jgi:signal peptidase II